jgi:Domain of unknown function (DUF4345)
MKSNKVVRHAAQGFILFSAFCFLTVSVMAMINPQSVMDLVHVHLNNNDAFSSIRGVYGGVGLTLVVALLFLFRKDIEKGLALLCLLWGFYAVSRIITIFVEGSLGAFGKQWLTTELILFFISSLLLIGMTRPYLMHKRTNS